MLLTNSSQVIRDRILEFFPEYQGDYIEFDSAWLQPEPGQRLFSLEIYSDGTPEYIREATEFEEIIFTAQQSIYGTVWANDEAGAIARALQIREENPGRKDFHVID